MNSNVSQTQKDKVASFATMLAERALPKLLGGGLIAGGSDYISYNGDYSNITPGRIGNGVLNTLLGTGAMKSFSHGTPEGLASGAAIIGSIPIKDLALQSVPAVSNLNKQISKNIEDSSKSWLERLSPTEQKVLAGVAGVGALTVIPALYHINQAAKRIGEGKAIRLSTSIRKRRNSNQDLTIGVKDLPTTQQDLEASKPKGFLGSLFSKDNDE